MTREFLGIGFGVIFPIMVNFMIERLFRNKSNMLSKRINTGYECVEYFFIFFINCIILLTIFLKLDYMLKVNYIYLGIFLVILVLVEVNLMFNVRSSIRNSLSCEEDNLSYYDVVQKINLKYFIMGILQCLKAYCIIIIATKLYIMDMTILSAFIIFLLCSIGFYFMYQGISNLRMGSRIMTPRISIEVAINDGGVYQCDEVYDMKDEYRLSLNKRENNMYINSHLYVNKSNIKYIKVDMVSKENIEISKYLF